MTKGHISKIVVVLDKSQKTQFMIRYADRSRQPSRKTVRQLLRKLAIAGIGPHGFEQLTYSAVAAILIASC